MPRATICAGCVIAPMQNSCRTMYEFVVIQMGPAAAGQYDADPGAAAHVDSVFPHVELMSKTMLNPSLHHLRLHTGMT